MAPKLVIWSLEKDPRCITVPTHLKTMDTMEEASTEAMVDTGATGVMDGFLRYVTPWGHYPI